MLKELDLFKDELKKYNFLFEKEKEISFSKKEEIKFILEKAFTSHNFVSIVYYDGNRYKYYVGYIKKIDTFVMFNTKFKVKLSKIKDIRIRSEL